MASGWGEEVVIEEMRPCCILLLAALLPVAVLARNGDDYQNGAAASAAAKAYFKAVPQKLESKKIFRLALAAVDEDGAYFTEDGGISIPSGAMIVFKGSGKCMDPHLPAPCCGEPMQFVDVGSLIPSKLRPMYGTLMERSAQGDPKVKANNLQHLVWALRTAGTDDPIANNLSDAQIDFLDECAGKRGAFLRFHEKEKKRNAKREGRSGRGGSGRISVGGYSYDAADLRGTNATRRIEQHMTTLTEMGERSAHRTDSDFRYGEIEDELYSDITCDGGLSYTAKILNASDRRREFRAVEFAAQVGDGKIAGSRRQRVTMCPPDEIMVVMGAAQVVCDLSDECTDIDIDVPPRIRGRTQQKRKPDGGKKKDKDSSKPRSRTPSGDNPPQSEEEIPPVPEIPPIPGPKPYFDEEVTNIFCVVEGVVVRVVSLEYDAKTRKGILIVEILRGSSRKAKKFVRRNFDDLVRKQSPAKDAAKIPADAKLEIESIAINDKDLCEVKFRTEERSL